jgi:hypothetical protein
MAPQVSVTIVDHLKQVSKAITTLADTRVMVGVPAQKTDRGQPITNAALAYIHEHGAPAANIPARPFMRPTIKARENEIAARLKRAASFAWAGNSGAVERELSRMGMETRDAIKMRIRSDIPPPLAMRTVMGRIYRRKSKTWRKKRIKEVHQNIAAGVPPQTGIFTALIDTAQMINSITYVLRKIGGNK